MLSSDQKRGSFTRGWSSIGRTRGNPLDLERDRVRCSREEVGWGVNTLLSEIFEIVCIFKIPDVSSNRASVDADGAAVSGDRGSDSDDVCDDRSDV